MKPYITINEAAFQSGLERLTLGKLKKGFRPGMQRVMQAWRAASVERVPKRSKNLMHSIRTQVEGSGFDVVGRIWATADYAPFVHNGTGLYGPRRDYIRRGYGFSRGQQPQPFFEEAWDDVRIGRIAIRDLFMQGFFSSIG